jgi:replicative DNA helicase
MSGPEDTTTGSRAVTERTLLGALLEEAESGWPSPAIDLQPDELCSAHAAATLQEIVRLQQSGHKLERHELVQALIERHGATRRDATAYLRLIRADAPRQHFLEEYVRRIREDNARRQQARDESGDRSS